MPLSEDNNSDLQAPSVFDAADSSATPEEVLARNELRALRGRFRAVVLLREFQGLTTPEIARRLGLTVAAVKARVFHARRHLRKHLEEKRKVRRADFLM